MTPAAPTLHTFDPQIAGKIGLYVDPPASYDQVIWKVAAASGGPYTEAGFTAKITGCDGLYVILDADSTTRYWIAQIHDGSNGYSNISNEIHTSASAGPPPPPPPLTAQQHLTAALGQTVNVGDQVAFYPQPAAVIDTVQADGSLA